MTGPAALWQKLALAALIVLFCTAPTPGDVGGCGQPAEQLDETAFFTAKAGIECERCDACELETLRCEQACQGATGENIPESCLALVHDGEVCLRALKYASCSELSAYVADRSPTVPWECNFCPVDQ